MWPNFGLFNTFMGEVMITQILYGFDQEKRFFWGVVMIQVQQFKNGSRYGPESL